MHGVRLFLSYAEQLCRSCPTDAHLSAHQSGVPDTSARPLSGVSGRSRGPYLPHDLARPGVGGNCGDPDSQEGEARQRALDVVVVERGADLYAQTRLSLRDDRIREPDDEHAEFEEPFGGGSCAFGVSEDDRHDRAWALPHIEPEDAQPVT